MYGYPNEKVINVCYTFSLSRSKLNAPKQGPIMTPHAAREKFAQETLAALREKEKAKRKRRFRTSKLDPYRADLVALRRAGATYRELVVWLNQAHRVAIHHTNVRRYLLGLREFRLPKGRANA